MTQSSKRMTVLEDFNSPPPHSESQDHLHRQIQICRAQHLTIGRPSVRKRTQSYKYKTWEGP